MLPSIVSSEIHPLGYEIDGYFHLAPQSAEKLSGLGITPCSTLTINDDVKIVRTPKNMAASVVNLPGMTLQPLYYKGVDSCL